MIKEIRETCLRADGTINESNIIDFGNLLPFRIGLKELEKKHERSKERYRIILIDSKKPTQLLTKLEQETSRADEEKRRADILEKEIANLKKK